MQEPHEHDLETVGEYTAVSGKASTITYRIEWCPTCKAAYQRPIAFLDGLRWKPEERLAAEGQERRDRHALIAKVHALRQGEDTDTAGQ